MKSLSCVVLASSALLLASPVDARAACPAPLWSATSFALSALVQDAPPAATAPATQADEGPKPLRPEDYGQWESLGFFTAMSNDGKWLAYSVNRVDGENELRVQMLATDEPKVFKYGGRPTYSNDSNWLAFSIGIGPKERERLAQSNQPAPVKYALYNLSTGDVSEIEGVTNASFSENSALMIMNRQSPRGGGGGGAGDIVVRDLSTGIDTSFGNVASYAFNEAGTLMAMIISRADKAGNGVQLYDITSGRLQTLDSADATYKSLVWREESSDLACLREMDHENDEDVSHHVLAWKNLDGDATSRSFNHVEDDTFSADMRLVDYAGLRWSDDGQTLLFGVKEWENKPKALTETDDEGDETSGDGEAGDAKPPAASMRKQADDGPKTLRETIKEPSNVQVWHADDVDIIPLQRRRAGALQRRNFLAAWRPWDRSFVQLGNDLTESVNVLEGATHAVGLDNTPYEDEKKFGPTVNDVYIIDVKTGERSKVLDRVKFILGGSPDGSHVLYVRDDHIWAYNIAAGTHRNLTGSVDAHFTNQEASQLTDEKSAYGLVGWTEDGSHLYLNDRYDIWELAVNGSSSRRLTNGAADSVRHRRVVLDFENERYVDPNQPMLVSLYGDRNKKSGYGLVHPDGHLERLAWKDKSIGRLVKAKDANTYAFVEQAADDSPDIFIAGEKLAGAKQVSATNPFQKDYQWGHSELISYQSTNGDDLQGALLYPANYEPGKKYPMIVYIYELRSQSLHSYQTPSETNAYSPAVFSAEGYFVYQPDIVYRAQNPGVSAVECVVPAVEKVLETGMIDEDRIGLVGHSWGAYQTAFIVTQTDMFAAGIAGAPLTNMMSMSMSIYWNSGQTDAWIFHESQGRMDRPFWQDVDTYIKNSPIFNIDNMNTPLLVAFGDDDGAVDFNQGVEMYNAARLAEKQFVMLVYPGENHGLRRRENQVDYHYRILDWFGHYLQGDEAESWITDGLSHLDREKQIKEMQKSSRGR